MNKKILCTLLSILSVISLTGCNYTTKVFGGSTTIRLKPNEKLQSITWKDTSLWYLTRPMRDNEVAETYTFTEDNDINVFEGTVTIIETKE